MLNRLTDSLNFQAEALSLRSERQRLIASNIANADTPGYVARDFDFATALRQATGQSSVGDSSVHGPKLGMAASNGGHLNHNGQPVGSREQPDMNYALASQTNL
ncbi:MAG: flagellar basal body rod protein FlgB, partial [Aquabacterium sp.]|nr:flagellar basal body rod protein FlgB [Aquabacterium sp.]